MPLAMTCDAVVVVMTCVLPFPAKFQKRSVRQFFLETLLPATELGLYERSGQLEDLDASISNSRKAVQLTEDGHPNNLKPRVLGNLGISQFSRYQCFGELTDVEESIINLRNAVTLTEDEHPDKPLYLSNLGSCQLVRFKHFGNLTDVENSISDLEQAVQLTKDQHPKKTYHLLCLGAAHQLHFDRLGKPADFVASVSAFRAAAQSLTSYPGDVLTAARTWAEASHRIDDMQSALVGYHMALEILPKVAWLGLSTASRQNPLFQGNSEHLSCLAATCAIQLGHLEEAVEVFDLGRSVFWQQASS